MAQSLRLPLINTKESDMTTPSFDVSFLKNVNIREYVDIDKSIDVRAFVFGNSAMANSTADAYGSNSHTETLTQTTVLQGVGSSSVSESVSATNGAHIIWNP
jgi:hypothetical protein